MRLGLWGLTKNLKNDVLLEAEDRPSDDMHCVLTCVPLAGVTGGGLGRHIRAALDKHASDVCSPRTRREMYNGVHLSLL